MLDILKSNLKYLIDIGEINVSDIDLETVNISIDNYPISYRITEIKQKNNFSISAEVRMFPVSYKLQSIKYSKCLEFNGDNPLDVIKFIENRVVIANILHEVYEFVNNHKGSLIIEDTGGHLNKFLNPNTSSSYVRLELSYIIDLEIEHIGINLFTYPTESHIFKLYGQIYPSIDKLKEYRTSIINKLLIKLLD